MTFIMKYLAGFALRWFPVVRAAVANPRVIVVALAGSLALAVTVEQSRIAAARRHALVAALEISNLVAQRDSTRNAAIANQRVAHILGDSLRLAEIRVVQVTQHNDALDKALGRERVARYVDNVAVDSLQRVVHAMSTDVQRSDAGAGQTVRSAFFDIRQEPYTVAAQVDIPPPPDSARIELHVAIDPIPIEARELFESGWAGTQGRLGVGDITDVGNSSIRPSRAVARGLRVAGAEGFGPVRARALQQASRDWSGAGAHPCGLEMGTLRGCRDRPRDVTVATLDCVT